MYENLCALVMGSLNMDMVLSLSRIPQAGESLLGDSYRFVNGGKGANQAVAAARLGAQVSCIGRVGRDIYGQKLIKGLQEDRVDTRYLITDEGESGLAVVMLEQTGANRIAVFPGANGRLETGDINRAFDQMTPDIFLLQMETPRETVIHAVRKAVERRIPVLLDAGPAQAFPLEEIQGMDILSPNETETEALCGIRPDTQDHVLEACRKLAERSRAKYIVLKLGSRGCAVYDGTRVEIVPAYPAPVVDTTAAGDCFTAALGLHYALSGDIYAAAEMGNKAGTLAVQKHGAQTSLPTFEDIESHVFVKM